MATRTEYLENFRSPLTEGVDGQTCLNSSLILAPWALQSVLIQARNYAESAPGPNLSRRELLVPLWLNFWIALAQNHASSLENKKLVRSYRVVPFNSVGEVVKKLIVKTTGVLNAAGMEGHPGHRKAVDYMATNVDVPILLLEGDEYFVQHPDRRKPFLPLIVRASMWAIYPRTGIISIAPPMRTKIEDTHYQEVFNRRGQLTVLPKPAIRMSWRNAHAVSGRLSLKFLISTNLETFGHQMLFKD